MYVADLTLGLNCTLTNGLCVSCGEILSSLRLISKVCIVLWVPYLPVICHLYLTKDVLLVANHLLGKSLLVLAYIGFVVPVTFTGWTIFTPDLLAHRVIAS